MQSKSVWKFFVLSVFSFSSFYTCSWKECVFSIVDCSVLYMLVMSCLFRTWYELFWLFCWDKEDFELGNILFLGLGADYIGVFILGKFTELYTYSLCTLCVLYFNQNLNNIYKIFFLSGFWKKDIVFSLIRNGKGQ